MQAQYGIASEEGTYFPLGRRRCFVERHTVKEAVADADPNPMGCLFHLVAHQPAEFGVFNAIHLEKVRPCSQKLKNCD